jgi:hypothetical protein
MVMLSGPEVGSEGMFWRPTRKEITEWMEQKEQEFSQKENKNPRLKNKKWLQRYVYTNLHEIFFGEFPNLLAKWIGNICGKDW